MGDCDCDCDWRILTTVINSFYHIIKQHEAKVQKANIIIYSTVPTEYDPFSHSIFVLIFISYSASLLIAIPICMYVSVSD